MNADYSRISGVFVRNRSESRQQHVQELTANLVVDASGRGTRTPQWLAHLGYERVEETRVK